MDSKQLENLISEISKEIEQYEEASDCITNSCIVKSNNIKELIEELKDEIKKNYEGENKYIKDSASLMSDLLHSIEVELKAIQSGINDKLAQLRQTRESYYNMQE